jgi:flagellar motor component MotA
VLSANVLWLPIAKRIERIVELEAARMELAVEGILAIQSGSNPRLVAQKLKGCADDEVSGKEMLIEGILAIQSGDNPRIVEEKLVAFLSTKDRAAYRAAAEAGAADLEMDLAA